MKHLTEEPNYKYIINMNLLSILFLLIIRYSGDNMLLLWLFISPLLWLWVFAGFTLEILVIYYAFKREKENILIIAIFELITLVFLCYAVYDYLYLADWNFHA